MRFFRLLLLILIFISCTVQKIADSLVDDDLPSQIQNYLRNVQIRKPYSICNVLVDLEDGRCSDIINSYIKFTKCKKIVTDRFDHRVFSDTELSLTVVAIKSFMKFKIKLDELVRSAYFTNRGNYKFVMCFKIGDINQLTFMLKQVWKNRLLDFVIMYFNSSLMMANYNPFTEKLDVFNNEVKKKFQEFPDKLRNMNGHPLKVFVLSKIIFPPSSNYNDYIYNFKKCLTDYLNATIADVVIQKDRSTVDQIQRRIMYEDVEMFPLLQVFTGRSIPEENKGKIMRLYPQTMNNLVVLVPKGNPIPKWRHFLKILWTLLLPINILVGLLTSVVNKYVSKVKKLDYLSFVAVELRIPMHRFLKEKSPVKAFWLLGCFLNGVLLDIFIFRNIINTYYEDEITSLDELRRSSLRIYNTDCPVPPGFNTTLVNKTMWHTKIRSNEKNAFVGSTDTFDRITKWHAIERRPFQYRVLPEIVQPAYGAFYCKAKSPYFKKINALALRVREYGASFRAFVNYEKRLVDESETMLLLENYFAVFVIWISGVCLSVLVLVAEICVRYGRLLCL